MARSERGGGTGGGSGPGRQMPCSPHAEMSLLGSMILEPRVIADVLPVVGDESDFHSARHAAIFRAIVDALDAHPDADLVHIHELIKDRGQLDLVGGEAYLLELAQSVPSGANAPYYARIVADKGRLRRLIHAAEQIVYDAHHVGELGPEGAREVLDRAERAVFEIAQERERSDPQQLAEILQQEFDRLMASDRGAITGVRSGFADLDRLLKGLQPGEVIVLAARPSMGKTAMALNIAEQAALGGYCPDEYRPEGAPSIPVGVFSLEMHKGALVDRLVAARSGVSTHEISAGRRLDGEERARVETAIDDLRGAPIFVDDAPALTVLTLRARARRMVAAHKVRLLVVDYLQLLSDPASAKESRQVEVSTISRGIKALARELKVPVLCLSQLNRSAEHRERNRPRMSDLRESGSIEQDADVVLLLHREAYYHQDDPEWREANPDRENLAEVIVAKQRNGPTGVVTLTWDAGATRFRNHALRGEYDEVAREPVSPGRGRGSWDARPLAAPVPAAGEPDADESEVPF
jgi:replicative DNA helicase